MTDAAPEQSPADGPVVVHRSRAGEPAAEQALVLAAMGIAHARLPAEGGERLVVAPADAGRAREQLALYAEENRPPPRSQGLAPGVAGAVEGVMVFGALLVLTHVWSRQGALGQDWVAAGAVQAGLIRAGDWWRTVTALGLHADLGHLASNLLFGGVLGLLAARALGAGLAWLAILAGGAGGNALNAMLRPDSHAAVGASTAVFAALGILTALALSGRWRRRLGGLRRWTPLAGGLMLLAYLGLGGERTDVGAHVAGFVVGGALGLPLAWRGGGLRDRPRLQEVLGVVAVAAFALAWMVALRVHAA